MTTVGPKKNTGFALIDDRRFNRILTSETSEQATRATNLREFFEDIIDRWFQGGKKRDAIINLFEAVAGIKNPGGDLNGADAEVARLDNFLKLAQLALPDYRGKFYIQIVDPIRRGEEAGYALFLGNKEIHRYNLANGASETLNDKIVNVEEALFSEVVSTLEKASDRSSTTGRESGKLNKHDEISRLRPSIHPDYYDEIIAKLAIRNQGSPALFSCHIE